MFTLTLAKRIQSFANFWKILECDSTELILFTRFLKQILHVCQPVRVLVFLSKAVKVHEIIIYLP